MQMKKHQVMFLLMGIAMLLAFIPAQLQAAQQQDNPFKVSGVVKDENNDPVIGASVVVLNTKIATVTDLDGKYTLDCPSANSEIQITYIGYEKLVVPVKGKSQLNVSLSLLPQNIGEVVVVAYGQQKKVSVTGAISSVSGKELTKVPTASIGNMLSGVLSGVATVQSSGQPGSDNPDIYVRGIGTLNASNSAPLMLVDGIERNISNLDPNDIESINVLKDASSTAVFGVRGANGVILVTTKRGSVSKAQVSASLSYGVQVPTRMIEMVNSYEWASLHNEARINDGKADQVSFTPEALEAFRTHSNPLVYPDVNWTDMLFKDFAPQTQGNLNISGGTEAVRYFTSVGFLSQGGMFKNFDLDYNSNFDYKRYNYRANLDINMTKTSLLTLNIGGILEKRNAPNVNQDANQLFRQIYWATPMGGAGIVDGKWILSNSNIIGNYIGKDGLSAYYGRGASQTSNNTLNVDLAFEQKLDFITKGLKFNIKGSYNTGFSLTKNTGTSVNSYTPYYMKDMTWLEPTPDPNDNTVVLVRSGVAGDSYYYEGTGMSRNWYAETSLNYKRDFDLHHVSALVLYNQSKRYYPDKTAWSEIPTGYVGLVGRATYDYNTTYLMEFNIGYNGSENFAPGKRYGTFPAFSLGWVMSQEKFMKNLDFINYLKLRASYGVVGNDKYIKDDQQQRFMYLVDAYYSGGGYNFGTGSSRFWTNGYYEGALGNPDLTWEKAYKKNIGIDLTTLNNRLTTTIDVFHEKRKDILAEPQTYPAYMGITLPVLNLGEVTNKGVEVAFKWNEQFKEKGFGYFANLNISYAKNNIDYMDEVPSKYTYTMQTGHPVGQPFGLKVRGFYYEGMPDVADQSFVLREGDVVYEDLNGDGKITDEDKTAIGYPNYPLLNGGLSFGFNYKGFDFSALIVGATLTSRYLQETFRTPFGEKLDGPVMKYQYEERWTPETRNTATLPIMSFDGMANNYKDSELWLKDASYLRLKNIQVSYTVNSKALKRLGIRELKPFASAYNLLTLDKLKIIDPESPTSDRPAYPLMLVMNLGVNINF